MLDLLLTRSPAQPFFRRRAERGLVVLAYHGVADPDRFARQMDYVAGAMHPVSGDEVREAIAGNGSLPRGAVLVTFDDGDRSVLEQGVEVLNARRIPAVIFVVADLIDSTTPFWWSEAEAFLGQGARVAGWPEEATPFVRRLKQVPNEERLAVLEALREDVPSLDVRSPQLRVDDLRSLEAAGVEIGNHTASHPCLNRCDGEVLEGELRRAHGILTEALGRQPTLFAYPNGDWDARAVPLLRALGYEAAFLFDHRIGRFPPADPYRISRVRVNSTTTMDRFRTIVSGLHPTIHHLRGRP